MTFSRYQLVTCTSQKEICSYNGVHEFSKRAYHHNENKASSYWSLRFP